MSFKKVKEDLCKFMELYPVWKKEIQETNKGTSMVWTLPKPMEDYIHFLGIYPDEKIQLFHSMGWIYLDENSDENTIRLFKNRIVSFTHKYLSMNLNK